MWKWIPIKILFLLPAGFDLIPFLSLLSFLFPLNTQLPFLNDRGFFIAWIISVVTFYVFIILHNIFSLMEARHTVAKVFNAIYKNNKTSLEISLVLTLSTFIMYIYMMSASFIPFFRFEYSLELYLFLKFTIMIFIILCFKYQLRTKKWKNIFIALVTIILTLIVVAFTYFMLGILDELSPQEYFIFPLNDPKGIYKLNYDGDYWLTYYHEEQQCSGSGKAKRCVPILVKLGNTSVTETPIPLDTYLEKPVQVKGEFQKILTFVEGDKKMLCIGTGMVKKCSISKGPGQWYASPLKITSIELIK